MSDYLNLYPTQLIILRLTCLVIGYLVIKLGYNLVSSGIKGEFKFSSEYKGIKGGLVSSSPGLLFVLLGAVIVIGAIYIDRPFDLTGLKSEMKSNMNVSNPIRHLQSDSLSSKPYEEVHLSKSPAIRKTIQK